MYITSIIIIFFLRASTLRIVSNALSLGERWLKEGFEAVSTLSSNEKLGEAIKPKIQKVLHKREKFEKTILITICDKFYKL